MNICPTCHTPSEWFICDDCWEYIQKNIFTEYKEWLDEINRVNLHNVSSTKKTHNVRLK